MKDWLVDAARTCVPLLVIAWVTFTFAAIEGWLPSFMR